MPTQLTAPDRRRQSPVSEPCGGPELDDDQRGVVAHRGGPLLVLGGPGTGKTTTLASAVIARIAGPTADLRPEQVLVLAFGRKAASRLRVRIGEHLPGTVIAPTVSTFHAFCNAVVHTYRRRPDRPPLRVLSGPEQDAAVRELVAGTVTDGSIDWPPELRAALGTRGFAEELRDVLSRARELALDPVDLAEAARRTGRSDWLAAASFFDQYLDVSELGGVIDYAGLLHLAVLLAQDERVGRELRERYRAIFVDEYQDTDRGQVALLRAIAGDGHDIVAFGDPDQSIYGFRGADAHAVAGFPDHFRHADGRPADIVTLRHGHRAGPRLVEATSRVAARIPLRGLPGVGATRGRSGTPSTLARELREPTAARGIDEGDVRVLMFPRPTAQAAAIADLVRRAHLEDGMPWHDMAVLVRSAGRSLPPLRRALTATGVPVISGDDELPLSSEPAVMALLRALSWADELRRDEAVGCTVDAARALLAGPLCGMDVADLRRLARALRVEERRAMAAEGSAGEPRPSEELLRDALLEPHRLATVEPRVAEPASRLGRLLHATARRLDEGAGMDEALWTLWQGVEGAEPSTGWARRLERAAARGGAAGRAANRDLDAVCVLFDYAARVEERSANRGVRNFVADIEAQRIAGESLAPRAARGDSVELVSAHKAKGRQWRLVVVADVQEGLWPDPRPRGSLLQPDRLGSLASSSEDVPPDPAAVRSALLAEERRLFYVAITRASERLVVSAVDSRLAGGDDAELPSRFVREMGVVVTPAVGDRRRPLTVAALVAELRARLVDPKTSDALRAAAADRLARLAAARDDEGVPMVRAAHPGTWWGSAELTDAAVPVRDPARPLKLSASQVVAARECALRWFLSHEARADQPASTSQEFGNVVHALVDEVAKGESPADLDVLMDRLDRVWDRLAFDAPWQSAQQRDDARAALERFIAWHVADRGRTVAASEHEFDVTLEAGGYRVRINGKIDRVETGVDGQVFLVDFKTGRHPETREQAAAHPQLAVYQLAAGAGALADTGAGTDVAGAELVYLRKGSGQPTVVGQPALRDSELGADWASRMLAEIAARVLDERFDAYGERDCRTCEYRGCCPKQPEGRQLVR